MIQLKQERLRYRRTQLGASEIIERLWVGEHVSFRPNLLTICQDADGHQIAQAGFDVYVPCAQELQSIYARERCTHLIVLPCPLGDNYFTVNEPIHLVQIHQTVDQIVALWKEGKTVLVTCSAGRNRSSMVAALAIKRIMKMNGHDAVTLLRQNRNPYFWRRAETGTLLMYKRGENYVLTNETFEEYVRTEQPVDPFRFSQS